MLEIKAGANNCEMLRIPIPPKPLLTVNSFIILSDNVKFVILYKIYLCKLSPFDIQSFCPSIINSFSSFNLGNMSIPLIKYIKFSNFKQFAIILNLYQSSCSFNVLLIPFKFFIFSINLYTVYFEHIFSIGIYCKCYTNDI